MHDDNTPTERTIPVAAPERLSSAEFQKILTEVMIDTDAIAGAYHLAAIVIADHDLALSKKLETIAHSCGDVIAYLTSRIENPK